MKKILNRNQINKILTIYRNNYRHNKIGNIQLFQVEVLKIYKN